MSTRSIAIKYTKDYDKFKMDSLNRDLRPAKLLEQSFQKHGYLYEYPVLCSENGDGTFHIHAGHHRFDLARRYDTGVWYMIVDPKLTIFEREASSHGVWSSTDFISAYAKAGNEQYVQLQIFARAHNIPPRAAASLLWGETTSASTNITHHLKDGTFIIRARDFAEAVVAVTDDLFSLGISFATMRSFVAAIAQLIHLEDFDSERLIHRVTLYPSNLHKRTTMDEYLEEIEALYNYGIRSGQRVPLAFLAKTAAAQRSAAQKSK